MKLQSKFWLAAYAVVLSAVLASPASAGLFLIDFGELGGAADGWDTFANFTVDTVYNITDRSADGDNDVMFTVLDDGFTPNNPAPPGVEFEYDGIVVPVEATNDYLYKTADIAGTSARLMFEGLNPGVYNITIFEGRTSDGSEFAKIWAGDAEGSNEPDDANTDNYAASSSTVEITLNAANPIFWYRHLEDNSGGISGMIIRQTAIPEPSSILLAALGAGALFVVRRKLR